MTVSMYDISMQPPGIAVNISWTKEADKRVALPAYQTDGAAGMDVRSNLAEEHRTKGIMLAPGERMLVPTGLRIEIPQGYEMQVRPRSGLALKSGVTVANAPGTIDSDYRGELGVVLINLGQEPFLIGHGDRVAQLVLAPVSRCEWHEVDKHSASPRGAGGFGSTGI